MKREYEEAGKEIIIQLVELVPGVSIFIEGVRKYKEEIERINLEKILKELSDRISYLKDSKDFYSTEDGQIILNKIVSSILSGQYEEKIDFFANVICNSPKNFEQYERLKFIEILKNISKPALYVLGADAELRKKSKMPSNPTVSVSTLVSETKMDGFTVQACINELFSLGVYQSNTKYSKDGEILGWFQKGTPAYTEYTKKFIDYISHPKNIEKQ